LTLEKLDKYIIKKIYIYIYTVKKILLKKILLKCKEKKKKVILKKRMESGKEEDACHIEKVTVGSVTKVQKKMLSSGRGHD
jgi:hypothetical protein